MKEINILWFKKDLRIFDNEALCESIKDNDILPIYIIELDIWSQNTHSDRQWQFCKESLIDLRNALAEIGQPLICLLYTSPSPRDATLSRMPSSA